MEDYEEQYIELVQKFCKEIDQTEMIKFIIGLRDRNIPFKAHTMENGLQVYGSGWDVICNAYSYGHEQGLLEILAKFVDTEDRIFVGNADEILALFDKWKEKENAYTCS